MSIEKRVREKERKKEGRKEGRKEKDIFICQLELLKFKDMLCKFLRLLLICRSN